MCRTWIALVAAAALALSGAARAQDSFENLGGTWWFRIGGKDAGAMLIAFTAPVGSVFETEDTLTGQPSFGFSRALGAFFVVESGQTLGFDSKGNVVGTLELTDPDTDASVGELTFEKGKPNKAFLKWRVRAAIEGDQGAPVIAKLMGKRLPETFPVLSGGDPETRLSGKGVKSRAFDLHVTSDTVLGLPAYGFAGAGPAEIDKVETPDTTLEGRFILSPTFALFGLLEDSSEFGTGDVTGSLKLRGESLVPTLRLIARADRKVVAKGKLVEATDPVLSVTPTSFDFGALHLDASQDRVFEVANVGAGSLSGEASVLSGDFADFSVEATASSYSDLDPNSPPESVTVRFAPTSMGAKSAEILFDVGGGRVGARIVTVTGVGGIAILAVDAESIDFPDTVVGSSSDQIVTVTNDGDGVLQGNAIVSGSDFTLLLPLGNTGVSVVPYNLDPGESLAFSVRFRPATTGAKSGSVTLTGGGGATIQLNGDGT